jgi:hypothetical protein
MSRGMWTKQHTAAGIPFYFNATQNKSLWKPPPTDLIHEAEYLKIPKTQPQLDAAENFERNDYETRPLPIELSIPVPPQPIPVLEYHFPASIPLVEAPPKP